MEEVSTHYCLGGESHLDGCDCQCSTCSTRREKLRLETFNRRLSQKIHEMFLDDSEFQQMLRKELLKK